LTKYFTEVKIVRHVSLTNIITITHTRKTQSQRLDQL